MRRSLGPSLIAVASAVVFSLASCSLQDSGTLDGLDPDPGTPVDADSLVLQPTDPTTAVNVSVTFAAPESTVNGTKVSGRVDWTASGGTIDSNGVFVASSAGVYTVQAGRGGRHGRSKVTVTSSETTITALTIAPASLSLQPGASFTFTVTGTRSDGASGPVAATWTATGGTVDVTGTYTAGSTTGTFPVIATLQGGTLADTASVRITTAPATLQTVVVSPATVTLASSATQQFSAVGRLGDGSTSSVVVTWSATGGVITSAGLYTAGSSTGTFRVIAVQQGGTRADTSTVTITTGAPTITAVEVTPASVTVSPGATQQFSATGRLSDGGTTGVSVTWSATGGSVTSGGLYTAGSTAGSFRIFAVRQGGTWADTSAITIAAPPPGATLQSIDVTPHTVRLDPGDTQQFSAVGQISDGSTASVSVSYSATGGTVTAGGLYTAGTTPGTFRVIAVRQGDTKADTSAITISTPAPTLQRIEVTPPLVTLDPGGSQQFSSVGRMSDGSTAGVSVTWSATGGTVNSAGRFTAGGAAGTFHVIAVQQGYTRADTSTITITTPAPTLQRMEVTPASVSVAAGATQQFAAVGRMSDGSATAVSVNWTATGGAVNSSGLYAAGGTAGAFRVIAVRQGDTRADTSTITINAAPTLSSVVLTPSTVSLAPGAKQQFNAAGKMSDGSTSSVAVTWSATGGSVSGGLYTAGTTAGTYRVIAVQQGGTKADTSVITIAAAPTSPTAPAPAPAPSPSNVPQPELPRVTVATGWALPTGTTRTVNAGGDLQGALNAAVAGDVIVLQAGATFTGNFTLPAKSGSGWIYVMSSGSLPGAGTRVGPGNAGQLAKIVSPNQGAALAVTGARYRLVGLEVTTTVTGSNENYGLVSLSGSQIILDRLFIHGTSGAWVRRGVALNSASSAVIDCYIAEVHSRGADAQAIAGWNGPGPFKIENNHLEASGENLMFGGADPAVTNLVPSDIEILRNHFYKPLSWQGAGWQVKNALELKNAQRVRIEGNVLENNWSDYQDGSLVVIMGVNQDGSAPWSIAQDITFRYNILKNAPGGLRIVGHYNDGRNPNGYRFLVAHNLFIVGQNSALGSAVHVLALADGARDVTIENNTVHGGYGLLSFWGEDANALSYRNNVVAFGNYGIFGDGVANGTPSLNAYVTSWTFTNNVMWGVGAQSNYPAGNQWAPSLSAVGFVNAAGGDYHLAGSSPYLTAGTGGSRPGADIDQLNARTSGVVR